MANNLNIPERTLNQLGSRLDTVNVIGGVGGRKSVYEPLVVRATDHQDNVVAEEDDPYKMALFVSQRHGEPFKKDCNVLEHVIHKAAATPDVPTNVSVLYPNFDYSTFE